MNGQVALESQLLQRIRRPTFPVGRRADGNDVLAVLEQTLQHGPSEGLLPVNDEPGAPTKTVRIIRAHLEEDAGKLLHEAQNGAISP